MRNAQDLIHSPYEVQKEQYDQKNDVLARFGRQVSASAFYEDIFNDLDMVMPIIIIDEDSEEKHMLKLSIAEALDQNLGRNDMLMGGVTFFNCFVRKNTARDIYSFIVDMDNVYSGVLLRAFEHNWKRENGMAVPMPTYIVNSGTGLHLYFVLTEPLPCYKRQMKDIDDLYRKLAKMETTGRVYLQESVQWFGQTFRMAGGCGKKGFENTVFQVGEKWDVDELGEFVGLKETHFYHHREKQSKQKKPLKKRRNVPKEGYYLNSRVYESSLERCRNEVHEGNRYMSMCALTVLAYKCNVSLERLEEDLKSLISIYNKDALHAFREKEIYSAMKMYNPKAILTPKERTEDWLGWKFKGSRRNGRSQKKHLEGARAIRDVNNEKWDENNGRKSKMEVVERWKLDHPEGKKADCIRDTGLDRKTVSKWWNGKEKGEEISKKQREVYAMRRNDGFSFVRESSVFTSDFDASYTEMLKVGDMKVKNGIWHEKLPEYYVLDGDPDMMQKVLALGAQGVRNVEVLSQDEYEYLAAKEKHIKE